MGTRFGDGMGASGVGRSGCQGSMGSRCRRPSRFSCFPADGASLRPYRGPPAFEVWPQAYATAFISSITFLPASGELTGRKNALVFPAKSSQPFVVLVSTIEESLVLILSHVNAHEGLVAQTEFVPFAIEAGGASTSESEFAKLCVRGTFAEYSSSSSNAPVGFCLTVPEKRSARMKLTFKEHPFSFAS